MQSEEKYSHLAIYRLLCSLERCNKHSRVCVFVFSDKPLTDSKTCVSADCETPSKAGKRLISEHRLMEVIKVLLGLWSAAVISAGGTVGQRHFPFSPSARHTTITGLSLENWNKCKVPNIAKVCCNLPKKLNTAIPPVLFAVSCDYPRSVVTIHFLFLTRRCTNLCCAYIYK